MRITNKFFLPKTFVNALERPTYSKGNAHISVTELLNAPRIVNLRRKHWDDLEEDASQMVWSLFGSAVHKILEIGKDPNHVVEERLFTDFEGWRISGQIDLQEMIPDGIMISDYKVTSAWSVMSDKEEWRHQLNIYAWLIERVKKVPVLSARVVAIVRDWSAKETREGYPQAPVTVVEIPLLEDKEALVSERIKKHNEGYFALQLGEEFPECTSSEMWERPTTYAVIKEGGVRAKSVHNTKEEAEAALSPGYSVTVRPGERIRCKSYCAVNKFCSQWRSYEAVQQ